ncbi:MAG: hypothetical protein IKP28_03225 [Clostridia bacterium]|nr:hypothetical protein [Clostridia bacterium]
MNNQKIENQNILSANQMSAELLLAIVMYGVICYIINYILYAIVVAKVIKQGNYGALVAFILCSHTLIISITLKLANKKAFKKGTIYKSEVGKVFKNVAFVIIVVLLFSVLGAYGNVESVVENKINENLWMKLENNIASSVLNKTQMSAYQESKENSIQKMKDTVYSYLTIVEIGIVAIYVTAIFIEKKSLYKKAIDVDDPINSNL